MEERRREARVPSVLDAIWHAQSGASRCRVTDLSWHGCFVQSVALPGYDDETSLTISVGNTDVRIRGRVRYVEPLMGFGFGFSEVTDRQLDALAAVIGPRVRFLPA